MTMGRGTDRRTGAKVEELCNKLDKLLLREVYGRDALAEDIVKEYLNIRWSVGVISPPRKCSLGQTA